MHVVLSSDQYEDIIEQSGITSSLNGPFVSVNGNFKQCLRSPWCFFLPFFPLFFFFLRQRYDRKRLTYQLRQTLMVLRNAGETMSWKRIRNSLCAFYTLKRIIRMVSETSVTLYQLHIIVSASPKAIKPNPSSQTKFFSPLPILQRSNTNKLPTMLIIFNPSRHLFIFRQNSVSNICICQEGLKLSHCLPNIVKRGDLRTCAFN